MPRFACDVTHAPTKPQQSAYRFSLVDAQFVAHDNGDSAAMLQRARAGTLPHFGVARFETAHRWVARFEASQTAHRVARFGCPPRIFCTPSLHQSLTGVPSFRKPSSKY